MHRLDADPVWCLFENVVTHCALVCYFGGFIFPHVCFRLKMSGTLCAAEPVKRRAEVMTVPWQGFPLAFHLKRGYTTHQCATHMLLRSNLINLIYDAPRMCSVHICVCVGPLCSALCETFLHLKVAPIMSSGFNRTYHVMFLCSSVHIHNLRVGLAVSVEDAISGKSVYHLLLKLFVFNVFLVYFVHH